MRRLLGLAAVGAAADSLAGCLPEANRTLPGCADVLSYCAGPSGHADASGTCDWTAEKVWPLEADSGYHWLPEDWGVCSATCGSSGRQTRDVVCVSTQGADFAAGSYTVVKDQFCDADLREYELEESQSCNRHSCETTGWETGSWSACEPSCGADAYRWRPVHCMTSRGRVLPWEDCGSSPSAVLSACGDCEAGEDGVAYAVSRWSACSTAGAGCGEGTSTRTITCVNATSGEEVGDWARCEAAGLELPESERACAAGACEAEVGVWALPPAADGAHTDCSALCSAGEQYLLSGPEGLPPICLNGTGDVDLTERSCDADRRPAVSRTCSTARCSFCDDEACSEQGTCRVSSFGLSRGCLCHDGIEGSYCEQHQLCVAEDGDTGPTDVDGNCCLGILDGDGHCCDAEGAVLDADGDCCDSGDLDVCGQCDGSATLVDLQGECCEVLGADGLCCASGVLDDCGVCDGDNTACAYGYTATAKLPWALRAGLKPAVVGPLLGVDPSRVEDGAVSSARVQTWSLNLTSQYPPVARHDIYRALDGWSDVDLYYVRINFECGNGVCDPGELCVEFSDVDNSGECCPGDCPFLMRDCPTAPGTISSAFCADHGRCLPASGTCDCHEGYTGEDCSLCDYAGGWRPDGDDGCYRTTETMPLWQAHSLTELSIASESRVVRPLTPEFNASLVNQTTVRMEMRNWETGVFITALAADGSGASVVRVAGNDTFSVDADELVAAPVGTSTVQLRVRSYDYGLTQSERWYFLEVYRDYTEGSTYKVMLSLLACLLGCARAKTLWWAAEEKLAINDRKAALVAKAHTYTVSYRADVERVERRKRYKTYARYGGS